MSRRDALKLSAVAAAGAATGGVVSAAAAAGHDEEILRFALTLERLQVAFYREAMTQPYLTGELAEYTRVVHGHELAHVELLAGLLGSSARSAPAFGFAKALGSVREFTLAAIAVEDLGVAAYDGQMPGLSTRALDTAAEIVSVEARHAAWIRDLAGLVPAPDAADQPLSPAQVRTRLAAVGVTIGGAQ